MRYSVKSAAWLLGLLLIAVCVVCLQLDIQSQQSQSVANKVPSPFRSRAGLVLTSRAIQDGDWPAAIRLAQSNMLRRPVPSESLSLMALARSAGNPATDPAATAMILEAAGRGWRDSIAQTYVAGFAFAQGQGDVAATRLDALWRTQSVSEQNEQLVKMMLADRALRQDFARRYVAGAPWSHAFLSWAMEQLPPDQLADFLRQVRELGGAMDCRSLAVAVKGMLISGDPGRAARTIWDSSCHGRESAAARLGASILPSDDAPIDPFGWEYPAESGLDRAYVDGALTYSATDFVRARLARRLTDLRPGLHRVSAIVAGAPPLIRLSCASNGRMTSQGPIAMIGGSAWIRIPETGCNAQSLTLEVSRGQGSIRNFEIH